MNINEKINLLKSFISHIKKTNDTSFEVNTNLSELNLDSLDVVELQLMFEEKTGVSTLDSTSPILTVQNLLDLIP